MKLPAEFRESLVIVVDDYFEMENDDPDASTLADAMLRALEQAAEDSDFESDDILAEIEEAAELEEPMLEVMEYEFTRNEELELTGEDVVQVIETLLHLEWTGGQDELDEDELESFEGFGDVPVEDEY